MGEFAGRLTQAQLAVVRAFRSPHSGRLEGRNLERVLIAAVAHGSGLTLGQMVPVGRSWAYAERRSSQPPGRPTVSFSATMRPLERVQRKGHGFSSGHEVPMVCGWEMVTGFNGAYGARRSFGAWVRVWLPTSLVRVIGLELGMTSRLEALYQAWFRLAYSEKKGTEFESWFASLASHALGTDFEPVAAHGRDGDFKCDGRRLSTKTIYQCYAPRQMNQAKTIAKINDDFHGALHYWPDWMLEWTLVHNRDEGLPPGVIQCLDQHRRQHPNITIAVWGSPQLERELFNKLDGPRREAVFGFAPSSDEIDELTFDDIVPIIEALQKEAPNTNLHTIKPPSPQKLQRNALSEAVADLLQAGRKKEALVGRYFDMHPSPELGEKIAVAFRRRYAELRVLDLSADDIFAKLQQYAGGGGPPKRQTAALAVLSYYFERCDIFEDADDE